MRINHFQAQNGPFVLKKLFWYKPLLLLSSNYWPFSLCKIKKKFLQQIQSYEDAHLWDQNGSFAPNIFLEKINIISNYLLAPFIVQNF